MSIVGQTVKTRRSALLILVIALLPSTAFADAGTPLIWASMFHLVFGNAIIGLIEGVLLSRIFKCPAWRSILILIAANYTSAWVGGFLVSGVLVSLPDITIENIRFWFCSFVLVSFLVTLLIEFPFFWFVMRPQGRSLARAAKATALVNGISYGLLFGWYWMASGTSMMTQLQVVSPSDLIQGDEYALFFISTDGSKILQSALNGRHTSVLSEVTAHSRNDRLFARRNASTGYDLFVHLDSEKRENERDDLIAANFSELAPVDRRISEGHSEKAEGTWFNFGQTPSLASKSDWEFNTGFWAIKGISGYNKKENASVCFSLETPFAAWIARNATQLEGGTVVFQLGDNQICILHPESRRIALVARGKGPIVAKLTMSNKTRQDNPTGPTLK
jgi:hypothetical protein